MTGGQSPATTPVSPRTLGCLIVAGLLACAFCAGVMIGTIATRILL